jgi:hypothetical protein
MSNITNSGFIIYDANNLKDIKILTGRNSQYLIDHLPCFINLKNLILSDQNFKNQFNNLNQDFWNRFANVNQRNFWNNRDFKNIIEQYVQNKPINDLKEELCIPCLRDHQDFFFHQGDCHKNHNNTIINFTPTNKKLDIPKGGKNNCGESEIDCAIRELVEEIYFKNNNGDIYTRDQVLMILNNDNFKNKFILSEKNIIFGNTKLYILNLLELINLNLYPILSNNDKLRNIDYNSEFFDVDFRNLFIQPEQNSNRLIKKIYDNMELILIKMNLIDSIPFYQKKRYLLTPQGRAQRILNEESRRKYLKYKNKYLNLKNKYNLD